MKITHTLLACLMGLCLCTAAVRSASGQDAPAQPAKRSVQEIQKDLQAVEEEMRGAGNPRDLLDPAKRAEVGPKVAPSMKKMIPLIEELGNAEPRARQQLASSTFQLRAMLSMIGDADTEAALKKAIEGDDAKAATQAKLTQQAGQWLGAAKDADAQKKLLDEVQAAARKDPTNDAFVSALMLMSQSAAKPELGKQAMDIVTNDLTGPMAKALKGMLEQQKAMMEAAGKQKEMEGKPLTIEAVKLDGTKFSTADWKGKVILVDFWATWCGPCLGELPRVKKAYADWHEKGLEILGVSCDKSGDALKNFLEKNKDMPWPQLFDVNNPGWHPLATSYGINGIPTMFLIDKKGILRSVSARQNYEEMIPKLLEEKAE